MFKNVRSISWFLKAFTNTRYTSWIFENTNKQMWQSTSWTFVFFNMMSESWISTTIQDWVQILVFEMVDFLVQQVFGKQILLRGALNLQWSGFQQSPRAVLAVQFWRCSSGRVLVQFWCSSDAVLLRAVLIGFSSGADVLTCLFAVLVACLCAYLLACQFAYLIVCLHAR